MPWRQRLGEALLLLLAARARRAPRCGRARGRPRPSPRRAASTSLWKNGSVVAELVAVADRAADDPAQHVAAALVAGQHAVGDQERAGADVVGDDAQRAVDRQVGSCA